MNRSDSYVSDSPVLCLRGMVGSEMVVVDTDTQMLWVLDGENDASITVHVAAGVRYDLSYIFVGQAQQTNRLSLDVVLAAGAYADVHVLGCARDASMLSVDARVLISEGATDAEGYLQTRTMLLGDDARVRMVPGLDVHHDQVAAGHGARIDRIDGESLWYMMSRGIDRTHAQSLLVRAALVGMVGSVMDDTHDADIVVEESMELLGF